MITILQLFHLQEALSNLDDYDKTCVESALQGVNSVVQQEWGNACPCQVSETNWSNVHCDFSFSVSCLRTSYFILQVVLVTDGSLGIGKGSLRNSLQTLKQRGDDKKFPLPFPFPTKLYIMCVANAEEVTSLLM